MEQLKKTANIVDKVLNVISKIFIVLACIVVIAVAILSITHFAGYELDSTTKTISIDSINFELSQEITTGTENMLLEMGIVTVFVVVAAIFITYMVRILRKILKPMKEGSPFVGTVSTDIRKLGSLVLIGGLALQWSQNLFLFYNQRVLELVVNEAVAKISVNYFLIDTTYVFAGILIFMLSYIFRYGEELQQQADETL